MSQAAGRDLDWYFRQALTQPGYPILDVRWKHSGKKLTLDITQTQPAEWGTYRIPGLEIAGGWKAGAGGRGGRQTRQVIDGISRKPKKVEVDPNGWWLLEDKKRER